MPLIPSSTCTICLLIPPKLTATGTRSSFVHHLLVQLSQQGSPLRFQLRLRQRRSVVFPRRTGSTVAVTIGGSPTAATSGPRTSLVLLLFVFLFLKLNTNLDTISKSSRNCPHLLPLNLRRRWPWPCEFSAVPRIGRRKRTLLEGRRARRVLAVLLLLLALALAPLTRGVAHRFRFGATARGHGPGRFGAWPGAGFARLFRRLGGLFVLGLGLVGVLKEKIYFKKSAIFDLRFFKIKTFWISKLRNFWNL